MRQSDDDKWEVQMAGGKWVKCESKTDAKIISEAPILEASWLENRPQIKAVAQRLQRTSEMMDRYNMRADARRFRRWVKLAGDN